IAVDSSGNAFVTGEVRSIKFPTTPGAFQKVSGDSWASDAFITKLNPAGSELVYSTFLGGNGHDWAYGIALDAADNAYVTGATESRNFPTASPFQAAHGDPVAEGGSASAYDAFVSKLDAAGSQLVYSTFLGGRG